MFFFPLLLLFFFSKKSQTAQQIWVKEWRAWTTLYKYWKSATQRNANFTLEFPGKGVSKPKKNIYTSRLRERLEFYLASIASTTFGIINYCCLIRNCLESNLFSNYHQGSVTQTCPNQQQDSESHPADIAFNSFTNTFDIPDFQPQPTKATSMGHFLWRNHFYCINIKNSISANHSLCKYT